MHNFHICTVEKQKDQVRDDKDKYESTLSLYKTRTKSSCENVGRLSRGARTTNVQKVLHKQEELGNSEQAIKASNVIRERIGYSDHFVNTSTKYRQ